MAEAVKVIVRCRPLNTRENNLKCRNVIEMDPKIGQCRLLKHDNASQPPKAFTFDGVFGVDSITESIYADICFPLIEGCVEGYNGTVFAYGQTGCGKSFTMQGIEDPSTQRGIIPRAFEHIFESIQLSENAKFLVNASYLEIYNEDIRDLLGKDHKAKLDVKEHPDTGVYVKGLTKSMCHSVREMEQLMERGGQNRSVGSTLMNADSSRSHSIFTIYVETCETGADGQEHIRAGKLNLVDLAGSERQAKTGASGDRLKEATKINLSLSALGNVISALVDGKSKHIPYRDSKLTRLLQDSLGGNTKTLMVACISPADNNYDETLSTLRYANRAKNIKNKPKINEDPKDALLREYQDEITLLRRVLTGEIAATPQLLEKLGLSGVSALNTASALQQVPSPAQQQQQQSPDNIEREVQRIKEEYEGKLSTMQKQFDEEKVNKEKLEQEVSKLQTNLKGALKKISAKADQSEFCDAKAEKIIRDFQQKAEHSEEHAVEKLSPSKSDGRADSPSKMLRGVAAKGLGMIKDRLGGSSTNMAVSISKKDITDEFTESDIHVVENRQVKSKSAMQNVAAHIQEEAVKRLNALQEQLVGTDMATTPVNKEELRQRHNKRKEHANQRQLKMINEIKKWEGEGIMVKVYDNLQDEIKVKNEKVERLNNDLQAAIVEIADLESEFQEEREQFLSTIRTLEQQLSLERQIIDRIQPTIRRDCNYYNVDRIKQQCVYIEEDQIWKIPALTVERTSLPKNNGSLSPESVRSYEARPEEDRYAAHLLNSQGEMVANNYFKSKRAEKLLSGSASGSAPRLLSQPLKSLTKLPTTDPVAESLRKPPVKLEALPASAFEKKKRKKKEPNF